PGYGPIQTKTWAHVNGIGRVIRPRAKGGIHCRVVRRRVGKDVALDPRAVAQLHRVTEPPEISQGDKTIPCPREAGGRVQGAGERGRPIGVQVGNRVVAESSERVAAGVLAGSITPEIAGELHPMRDVTISVDL